MKERPKVSDEEIQRYMNFDSLVAQHQSQQKLARSWLKNTVLLLALVGAGVATYFVIPAKKSSGENKEMEMQEPAPVRVDSTALKTESVARESEEKPAEMNAKRSDLATKKNDNNVKAEAQKSEQVKPTETLPSAFKYQEAEPADGYPNLYDYFARELKYPEAALRDSIPIQGVVSVSFVIDKEGKPTRINIQNSLGPLFDAEAKRLIENMPTWRPATLNGKPVPAKIAVPLTFQVEQINPERK